MRALFASGCSNFFTSGTGACLCRSAPPRAYNEFRHCLGEDDQHSALRQSAICASGRVVASLVIESAAMGSAAATLVHHVGVAPCSEQDPRLAELSKSPMRGTLRLADRTAGRVTTGAIMLLRAGGRATAAAGVARLMGSKAQVRGAHGRWKIEGGRGGGVPGLSPHPPVLFAPRLFWWPLLGLMPSEASTCSPIPRAALMQPELSPHAAPRRGLAGSGRLRSCSC